MGFSTVEMDKKLALNLIKMRHSFDEIEVDSASDNDLFLKWPKLGDIVSACKSDHGHIILNLREGRFVDYKLLS